MDFFHLVAPIYDLAMKLTGHDKSLNRVVQAIDFKKGKEQLLDVGGGTGRLVRLLRKILTGNYWFMFILSIELKREMKFLLSCCRIL